MRIKTAPVRRWSIWGRLNGARAARDVRLQPITTISQPMFNFAHFLVSTSRCPRLFELTATSVRA